MSRALVIVDPEFDFIAGSLAVPNADAAITYIADIAEDYDYVVFTADQHPPDHFSFSEEPQFVDGSWPVHCVKDTKGAELDPRLRDEWGNAPVFAKGTDRNVEAYSGFDGRNEEGETLSEWLEDRNVENIDIVGLATDYCVKATAIDGALLGFDTSVILPGVRGVAQETSEQALHAMLEAGVTIEY